MTLSGGSYTGRGVFLGPADWEDVLRVLAGWQLVKDRQDFLFKRIRDQIPEPMTCLVDPDPFDGGGEVAAAAAAQRALSHLPIEAGRHATSAELSEALKELAHGLAALARSGNVAKR